MYETNIEGVFMVGGRLLISTSNDLNGQVEEVFHWRSRYGGVSFQLKGFWSNRTGRVCMVGNVTDIWREGNMPDLDVVLKLSGVKNSFTITSLINGTRERLNPTNDISSHSREKLSLFMIPQSHTEYNYT